MAVLPPGSHFSGRGGRCGSSSGRRCRARSGSDSVWRRCHGRTAGIGYRGRCPRAGVRAGAGGDSPTGRPRSATRRYREIVPLGRWPSCFVRRCTMAIEALGPDRIAFGSDVVGFGVRQDAVSLRLADGRTVEGDVLIGADGVGSVIRRFLFPDDPPPRRAATGRSAACRTVRARASAISALSRTSVMVLKARPFGRALTGSTGMSLLAADLPADTRDQEPWLNT